MLKTLERWWKEEEELHPDKPELTLALTKLMVGMMAMDGVMHENQKAEIIKQLSERFDLSAEESEELMQQASESDHRFEVLVEQINESFDVAERTTILQELWQVAIADGEVDFREDRFINRLSGLLGVPADCLGKTKASGADLKHIQPTFTG
ncbi:MAG: TerB family tellurite resistance protein [Mariprofundaceae bacterium]